MNYYDLARLMGERIPRPPFADMSFLKKKGNAEVVLGDFLWDEKLPSFVARFSCLTPSVPAGTEKVALAEITRCRSGRAVRRIS